MPCIGGGGAISDRGARKDILKRRYLIRDMNEETGPVMLRFGGIFHSECVYVCAWARACVCMCVCTRVCVYVSSNVHRQDWL